MTRSTDRSGKTAGNNDDPLRAFWLAQRRYLLGLAHNIERRPLPLQADARWASLLTDLRAAIADIEARYPVRKTEQSTP